MSVPALCSNDATLGPGSFCFDLDFTLAFEQLVLGLLPAAIFVAVAIFTIVMQPRKIHARRIVSHSITSSFRFFLASALAIVTAIGLAVSPRIVSLSSTISLDTQSQWPGSIIGASQALNLVAAVLLLPTLLALQRTAIVPNVPRTRLVVFYLVRVLGCATYLRSMSLRRLDSAFPIAAGIEMILACLFGLLLAFEVALPFMPLADPDETQSNPEENLGIFGSLMWWLLPMLLYGFRNPLQTRNLFPLMHRFDAKELYGKLSSVGMFADQAGTPSRSGLRLVWALMRSTPSIFFGPVLPRTLLIGVQLLQPLAVERLVTYVGGAQVGQGSADTETEEQEHPSRAWALAAGVSLLYCLIAFINGVYWTQVYQASLSFRSALVPAIFRKAVQQHAPLIQYTSDGGGQPERTGPGSSSQSSELSSGSQTSPDPITLMSVDVERIVGAMELLHDFWASIPTVGIGCYLLYNILGVAAFASLGTLLLALSMTSLMGMRIPKLEKRCLQATEARVAFTSSIVSQLKTIVFGSYQSYFLQRARELRDKEVRQMQSFSNAMIPCATLSNSAGFLSGCLAFAVAYLLSQRGGQYLDAAAVFSAFSVVQIIQGPVNTVGQNLSTLLGATASFGRLEEYLSLEHTTTSSEFTLPRYMEPLSERIGDGASGKGESHLLHLVGEGATGKTTILRSLLRHLLLESPQQVGYCPQNAGCLDRLSIHDNITLAERAVTGDADDRLQSVLHFCRLDVDIANFRAGMHTEASTLSGGQKQRVTLARVLYSRAPLLLLDDCLSAQDAVTGSQILRNLYGQGDSDSRALLAGRRILYASHTATLYDDARHIFVARKVGDTYTIGTGPSSLTQASQDTISAHQATRAERQRAEELVQIEEPDHSEEVHSSSLGLAPYKFYFGAAESLVVIAVILLSAMGAAAQFGIQFSLQAWVSVDSGELPRPGLYLSMMGFCALAAMFGLYAALQMWYGKSIITTSRNIHEKVLQSILAASPHDLSDVSVLLNRLTQDMTIVDMEFPNQTHNFLYTSLTLVGSLITLVIALPYFALAIPGLLGLFWVLQLLYLRCSRQLRSMELESKTALFSIFTQVSQAKETIQALRLSNDFAQRCDCIINQMQEPFYARTSMMRFLRMSLFLTTWAVVTIVAVLAVRLSDRVSPALLGVALSNMTSLATTINSTLTSFTFMETAAVAAERLRKLSLLPAEEPDLGERSLTRTSDGVNMDVMPLPNSKLPSIEIRKASMRYAPDAPTILKELSLAVPQGSKLGIRGRSGSGKSSLVMLLLRGAKEELVDGDMILYGQHSSKELSLRTWRRQLSYVPQDPLIWKATIRELLTLQLPNGITDPETDTRLWAALDAAGLRKKIADTAAGLDTIYDAEATDERPAPDAERSVSPRAEASSAASVHSKADAISMPNNTGALATSASASTTVHQAATISSTVRLSTGEVHRLAFARALLEDDRPIMLLDEATSSLDDAAEEVIIEAIKNKLGRTRYGARRSVVAVSHHIRFVKDFDHVVVMGDGEIIEEGRPSVLLKDASTANGAFAHLAALQGVFG